MQNKSVVIDSYLSRGGSSQRTPVGSDQKINKSELFRSPSSRKITNNESVKINRSPVSEVKLNPRLSEVVVKYSDRLLNSDKKSNKVERASSRNYQPGYIDLSQYIRQEPSKRPSVQNSIPRTEKIQPRPLIVQPKHSVPA